MACCIASSITLAFRPGACAGTDNRITYSNGCCDGDWIVIDFRDEQSDGNDGSGMLYINNTSVSPNTIESYRIDGQLGYTWKTYGPFCAYEGWHNFTYVSDANPEETSFTITDSFGLIKAQGDMSSFPVRFHTILPSKYCTPEEYTPLQKRQRVRKLIATHDQCTPREQLIEEGLAIPQDKYVQDGVTYPPLSVFDNNNTDLDLSRRENGLSGSGRTGAAGIGQGGPLY